MFHFLVPVIFHNNSQFSYIFRKKITATDAHAIFYLKMSSKGYLPIIFELK